jgi:hypothetical protein
VLANGTAEEVALHLTINVAQDHWIDDTVSPAAVCHLPDFANVWQAADKVACSTTLAAVSTANTRLRTPLRPRRGTRHEGGGHQ